MAKQSTQQLCKGQWWKTTQGLVQIVDLGGRLVYYRLTRDRNSISLTRMLRRDVFEQQLNTLAATLLN